MASHRRCKLCANGRPCRWHGGKFRTKYQTDRDSKANMAAKQRNMTSQMRVTA